IKRKACIERPQGIDQASVGAGRLFVRYLRETGVVCQPPSPLRATERWPRLREFRLWMHQHRGVMESSLNLWERHIVALLEALGDDAKLYTAKAVRVFVL